MTPSKSFSNPYHHPFLKPVVVDFKEVAELAQNCFEIIFASQSIPSLWVDDLEGLEERNDWAFPTLVHRHLQTAEGRLSRALVKLAILYRVLDDQLADDENYNEFQTSQQTLLGPFLVIYEGGAIPDTLREACNKIIHCEDFRPVYDNGGEGPFYMDSTLELEGTRGAKNWHVGVNLLNLLEGIVDTTNFLVSR